MVFSTMTAATAISAVASFVTGTGAYDWRAPLSSHLLVAALSLGARRALGPLEPGEPLSLLHCTPRR